MLAFLKSEALHPSDFTIREDGVVRLNPELARTVSVRFVLPIADIEVHSYHHLSHRVAQLVCSDLQASVLVATLESCFFNATKGCNRTVLQERRILPCFPPGEIGSGLLLSFPNAREPVA